VASFLKELTRRKVVKVGVAYAALAWLIAQISETVFPVFALPNGILRVAFIILGLGFPVTIVLAWIYDLTPEGVRRTDDSPAESGQQRLSGRGLDFTIIGCLSVAVLFLILDRYFLEPLRNEVVATVAVLPFSTSGLTEPGSDVSYLSGGITDSLIMRLSRIPRLKVKSRSMTLQAGENVREIGEVLGVDAVCMGRLTRRDDALEIVVELVDADDGSVMWSNRYTRRTSNLISIESEISAEIANALKVRLSVEEETELARAPTSNAGAYRLYLQGRFFWNQRSEEGLRRSADFFQRAIDLDPDYALAWSGLADSYLMIFAWGIEPPEVAANRARSAAIRAAALDPTLAEPHATLGYLKTLYDYDWEGAEQEFLRAFELNDNYSTAHHWYAFYLSTMGDSKGAIVEILKARDAEPLSPIVNSEVSLFYIYDGQYAKAIEELRAASLISPQFPSLLNGLIRAYTLNGQVAEALEILQAGRDSYGGNIVAAGFGNVVLPKLGLHAEARSFYLYALDTSATSYVMPAILGLLAASIGENDAAFAHFNRALDERSMIMSWLRDPLIVNIRADSRYAELFDRVDLTP
jgi:TolB-like protein/Flp pilus assembly protein TadD